MTRNVKTLQDALEAIARNLGLPNLAGPSRIADAAIRCHAHSLKTLDALEKICGALGMEKDASPDEIAKAAAQQDAALSRIAMAMEVVVEADPAEIADAVEALVAMEPAEILDKPVFCVSEVSIKEAGREVTVSLEHTNPDDLPESAQRLAAGLWAIAGRQDVTRPPAEIADAVEALTILEPDEERGPIEEGMRQAVEAGGPLGGLTFISHVLDRSANLDEAKRWNDAQDDATEPEPAE